MKHPVLLLTSLFFAPFLTACANPRPATQPTLAIRPLAPATKPSLGPGDHLRQLEVDGRTRSYLIHVPPRLDSRKAVPVVLIFHGAGMNAGLMVQFSGMNAKADEAGFVAVYPNGTGLGNAFLTFTAWDPPRTAKDVDDVKFTSLLLDDLGTVVNVDASRVFVTGMSNGGFMCYRLAAELSDRIAAIAPVAGTLAVANPQPKRPVPVIHFHGTADTIVPFDGPSQRTPRFLHFRSVEETISTWVRLNGCPEEPQATELPVSVEDGTRVIRKVYGPGREGAEMILYVIEGGGHTWPGREPPVRFLGKSMKNLSANDLIWEFFSKHPKK